MTPENLRDLNAFVTVADEASFTRAAARLGVSQSALSQTIRQLEARLGIRLLNRTTRHVSPTDAGEQLLAQVVPALDQIDRGFMRLGALRDRPSGTVRLTADEYAIHSILQPVLPAFMDEYPDISVELISDYGRIDVARDGIDMGVRRGALVSKDMIAMRIGADIDMAVVAARDVIDPAHLPTRPHDLADHNCINLRLPTHGEIFAWTFFDHAAGRDLRIATKGRLVLTSIFHVRTACLAGGGLAYLPRPFVARHIEDGRLVEVLHDWRKTFEGYHLYYPSRRQRPPALAALIETLRLRVGTASDTPAGTPTGPR
ncbi:MAG: LysR family transcriptional regulator [Paracoccus denitrificans]|nr:MAG: LysR family transcriptional regulator [Paracoccus denitrificans]PZO86365.1 MAG: LysR family transcriptional regulator [Paracoccus denitrificans]